MKFSPENNALYQVQEFMVRIPVAYRDMVCLINDWSIPTYYRKIREIEHEGKILMPKLSGAENYSVIRQATSIYDQLGAFLEELSLPLGIDFQREIIKVESARLGKKLFKPKAVLQSTAKPVENPPYQFGMPLEINNLSRSTNSDDSYDTDEE